MSKKLKPSRVLVTVLPFDCFFEIFSFFSFPKTVCNIMRTCKEFMEMIFNEGIYLFHNVQFRLDISSTLKQNIQVLLDENNGYSAPFVKFLCISMNESEERGLVDLNTFFRNQITERKLEIMMRKFPLLEIFTMFNCDVSIHSKLVFANLKRLKSFHFIFANLIKATTLATNYWLTSFNVGSLDQCKLLKNIKFYDRNQKLILTGSKTSDLDSTNVKELLLGITNPIPYDVMIPRFQKLENLKISECPDSQDWSFIPMLRNLRTLDIEGYLDGCVDFDLKGEHIECLDRLEEFCISWKVFGKFVNESETVKFPMNLKKMSLLRTTSGGLSSNLPNLKFLNKFLLSKTGKHVLKNLETLDIRLESIASEFLSYELDTCKYLKFEIIPRLLSLNKSFKICLLCCTGHGILDERPVYTNLSDVSVSLIECEDCRRFHVTCKKCRVCYGCKKSKLKCGEKFKCGTFSHNIGKYKFCKECVIACECTDCESYENMYLCHECHKTQKFCGFCKNTKAFCSLRKCEKCDTLTCRACAKRCEPCNLSLQISDLEIPFLCEKCYSETNQEAICEICTRHGCVNCVKKCDICKKNFCPSKFEGLYMQIQVGCLKNATPLYKCETCKRQVCKNCVPMKTKYCTAFVGTHGKDAVHYGMKYCKTCEPPSEDNCKNCRGRGGWRF